MEVMTNGIAAEIRGELAKRKMTLTELSERTGMHFSTISRKVSLETRGLTMLEVHKIASALGITATELVSRAEGQGLA